ncbi:MAG: hypothetical protein RIC56_14530 [Pseudomonadales bacterium]
MRHAGPQTLEAIAPLLAVLRRLPGLKEPRTGVFYRNSRAFLHFHEDGERVFADLRLWGPEFERYPATSRAERRALVRRITAALA